MENEMQTTQKTQQPPSSNNASIQQRQRHSFQQTPSNQTTENNSLTINSFVKLISHMRIKTPFKGFQTRCLHHMRWQAVPTLHTSYTPETPTQFRPTSGYCQFKAIVPCRGVSLSVEHRFQYHIFYWMKCLP